MQATTQIDDEQLATHAARGDREAFVALYERFAGPLYDFAVRTTRNPDTAADVVQTTFVKAWEALPRRKPGASLKAWLFTVARNTAIDEFRKSSRSVPLRTQDADDDMSAPSIAFTAVDPDRLADPELALRDRSLVELVWEAASALGPRDYTLLDLHLRQGLDADELATALGATKGNVYTMLTRLRQALAESVTSLLMLRQGRRECPELDTLLAGREESLTRELRATIARHVEDCPRCRERSRRLVSPIEIFAGLAPVSLTPGLSNRLWRRISAELESRRRAAQAPRRGVARPRTLALAVIVGVVATFAGIAAVLGLGYGAPAPRDPNDAHSPSHEVGQRSRVRVITVVWTPVEGARGYSIAWDSDPLGLPDNVADLPGAASQAVSPPLADGAWYFHLRTKGEKGRWTSTVHLGPFLLLGGDGQEGPPGTQTPPTPGVTNTPTPTPTPTPTSTPTPTRTATVVPAVPTPTATPPTPTETATTSATTQPATPTETRTPTMTPNQPTPTVDLPPTMGPPPPTSGH